MARRVRSPSFDAALALGGPHTRYYLARIVTPIPVVLNIAEPFSLTPVVIDPDATGLAMVPAEQYLLRIADRLRARGLTSVNTAVVASELTAQTLLDLAQEHGVDLIAIATHGRGVSRLVLGSVADKLLRGGTKAMLVSRGPHA